MVRALLILTALVVLAPIARADPDDAVALLPLDADKALEIYGQPVASEIARALVAGHVDVVVVGPKMAVPPRARLILDGTITAKGAAVILSVRMRNPVDGTTLLTLSSTAPSLANIDTAAAEVSAKVLPAVRDRLAAMTAVHEPVRPKPVVTAATAPVLAPVRIAVTARGASAEPLRAALATEVTAWATAHHRAAVPLDAAPAAGTELAIAFDIAKLTLDPGEVPTGRARVRVRISDGTGVVFDRVVITDSVVGERAMPAAALTGRIAREVLEILRPHLRRLVPSWR